MKRTIETNLWIGDAAYWVAETTPRIPCKYCGQEGRPEYVVGSEMIAHVRFYVGHFTYITLYGTALREEEAFATEAEAQAECDRRNMVDLGVRGLRDNEKDN